MVTATFLDCGIIEWIKTYKMFWTVGRRSVLIATKFLSIVLAHRESSVSETCNHLYCFCFKFLSNSRSKSYFFYFQLFCHCFIALDMECIPSWASSCFSCISHVESMNEWIIKVYIFSKSFLNAQHSAGYWRLNQTDVFFMDIHGWLYNYSGDLSRVRWDYILMTKIYLGWPDKWVMAGTRYVAVNVGRQMGSILVKELVEMSVWLVIRTGELHEVPCRNNAGNCTNNS